MAIITIKPNLCVMCHVNPQIEGSDKPICYDLVCQIRYNEANNCFTPKLCTKCGNKHTSYLPVCNRCRVRLNWK